MTGAAGRWLPRSLSAAHSVGVYASRTLGRVTPSDRCSCSSGTNHSRVAWAVSIMIRRGCAPSPRGLHRRRPPGGCSVAEWTGMVIRFHQESGWKTRAPGGTRDVPRVQRLLSRGCVPSTTRRAQGISAARPRCRTRRARRQSRTPSRMPRGSSSSSATKLSTSAVWRRHPPAASRSSRPVAHPDRHLASPMIPAQEEVHRWRPVSRPQSERRCAGDGRRAPLPTGSVPPRQPGGP